MTKSKNKIDRTSRQTVKSVVKSTSHTTGSKEVQPPSVTEGLNEEKTSVAEGFKELAQRLKNIYDQTESMQAGIIALFCSGDVKLYEHLGYDTETDFRIGFTNYGETQFRKMKYCGMQLIGASPFESKKLSEKLKYELGHSQISNVIELIFNDKTFIELSEIFNSLGIEKINHYLKKNPNASLLGIKRTGIVRFEDGKEMSLSDYNDLNLKKWLESEKEKAEKSKNEKEKLTKEKQILKAGKEKDEAEIEYYKTRVENFRELESELEPQKLRTEEKLRSLQEVIIVTQTGKPNIHVNTLDFLSRLEGKLLTFEFDLDCPNSIKSTLFTIMEKLAFLNERVRTNYQDLLFEFEGYMQNHKPDAIITEILTEHKNKLESNNDRIGFGTSPGGEQSGRARPQTGSSESLCEEPGS